MSQRPPATGKRAALATDAARTCHSGQQPDGRQAAGLDTTLAATSGRSGLAKDRLHGSLSEILSETDGQLTAEAHDGHPVTLAAACPPSSPSASPGPAGAPGATAAVLPFRTPGRPAQPGRR